MNFKLEEDFKDDLIEVLEGSVWESMTSS